MLETSPMKRYSHGPNERQQIEDLEEQLRMLSQTAAHAIDRVTQLETELEAVQKERTMSPSSSMSSLSSIASGSSSEFNSEQSSPTKRLETLEHAVRAIHRARAELSAPHNYQYL